MYFRQMNDPNLATYCFPLPPNASTSIPDPKLSISMFHNGELPSAIHSSKPVSKVEPFERSREEEEHEMQSASEASFAKGFAMCSIDGQQKSYEEPYPKLKAPPTSPVMVTRQSSSTDQTETESLELYKETAALIPYGRPPRMQDNSKGSYGSYQDSYASARERNHIAKPLSYRTAEQDDRIAANVREGEVEYHRPRPQYQAAANTNAGPRHAQNPYQRAYPQQQRSRQQGRSEPCESIPRLGQYPTLSNNKPVDEPRRIYKCLNSPHQLKKAAQLHDSGFSSSELQSSTKPIVRAKPYDCWDPNFPPRGERFQSQRLVDRVANDATTCELRGEQEEQQKMEEDCHQYLTPASQSSVMAANPKAKLLTEAEFRHRLERGPSITIMASPVLGVFADIRLQAEKVDELVRRIVGEAPVKAVDKMKGVMSSTSFKQELLEMVGEFHERTQRGYETIVDTVNSNSYQTDPYTSLFRHLGPDRVDMCYIELKSQLKKTGQALGKMAWEKCVASKSKKMKNEMAPLMAAVKEDIRVLIEKVEEHINPGNQTKIGMAYTVIGNYQMAYEKWRDL